MHLTNGILFNHESAPRPTFVTRKITRAVARISQGKMKTLYLGNLDAKRDWGHARDYVEGMWLMVQRDEPGRLRALDGRVPLGQGFARVAFARVGITVQWKGEAGSVDEIGVDAKDLSRVLVKVDPKYFRPTLCPTVDLLVGDCSKASRCWAGRPRSPSRRLAETVDADLAELRRGIAQEGRVRHACPPPRCLLLCVRPRDSGGARSGRPSAGGHLVVAARVAHAHEERRVAPFQLLLERGHRRAARPLKNVPGHGVVGDEVHDEARHAFP